LSPPPSTLDPPWRSCAHVASVLLQRLLAHRFAFGRQQKRKKRESSRGVLSKRAHLSIGLRNVLSLQARLRGTADTPRLSKIRSCRVNTLPPTQAIYCSSIVTELFGCGLKRFEERAIRPGDQRKSRRSAGTRGFSFFLVEEWTTTTTTTTKQRPVLGRIDGFRKHRKSRKNNPHSEEERTRDCRVGSEG